MKSEINNFNPSNLKSPTKGLDIVFIFDKSGSMGEQINNLASAHNNFIQDSKNWGQNFTITTVAFDNEVTTVCDGKNIKNTKPIKLESSGATAIYDAIGTAIDFINKQKENPENPNRNNDVCYVTVTDGYENASKLYNKVEINEKVERERTRTDYGSRDFILFGEYNIDHEKVAADVGISENNSQVYIGNNLGVGALFTGIDMAIQFMQKEGKIPEEWKAQAGAVKVGNFEVTKIRESLDEYRKLFNAFETSFSALEVSADVNGLNQDFHDKFVNVNKNLSIIEAKVFAFNGGDTVTDMLCEYITKKRTQLDNVKIIAAKSEIAKRLDANEILISKIKNTFDSFAVSEVLNNLAKIEDCSNKILYKMSHPAFAARIILHHRIINNLCSKNNFNPALGKNKMDSQFDGIISSIQE